MQTQRTFVSEPAAEATHAPQGDAREGAGSLAFTPTSKKQLRRKLALVWAENVTLKAVVKAERIRNRNLVRLLGAKVGKL